MFGTSFIANAIRSLFAGLCYGIYSIIEIVMQGIFELASLEATVSLVSDVRTRIYVFLGIFMVFKLTISLLNYVVNPDAMNDKEKGVSKLIGRTITMLVILILLPFLFNGPSGRGLLPRAQEALLPMLPRVILGQDVDNSTTVKDAAENMSVATMKAFFRPNPNNGPNPEITSLKDMWDWCTDKKNGEYKYDFNYIIALAVGVIMVIVLVMMTIKVAIRFFKMFILEMIAPIPVMSYIDPKSSKDGAFASWVKQLTTTFLDLFFRLGTIYIVLFFIGKLTDPVEPLVTLPNGDIGLYLMVFLIIGLLLFAKDAPNFIKDALGIKHDKDTSGALAGITSGALGFGTGAASGLISGRGVRGALTGGLTGANAGWQSGMTGKKASAWQSGGDAAIQARKGDKNAKSGVLAFLGTSASGRQMKAVAKKLNITDETLEDAKNNMYARQAEAATAERNFQIGLHTGTFRDLNGNELKSYRNTGTAAAPVWVEDADAGTYARVGQDAAGNYIYKEKGNVRTQADNIVASTSTDATKAQKNYESNKKAYTEDYGQKRTTEQEYKYEQKKLRPKYKAREMTRKEYREEGRFNPNKPGDRP